MTAADGSDFGVSHPVHVCSVAGSRQTPYVFAGNDSGANVGGVDAPTPYSNPSEI